MASRPASVGSCEAALIKAEMRLMFWRLLAANLITAIVIVLLLLVALSLTS